MKIINRYSLENLFLTKDFQRDEDNEIIDSYGNVAQMNVLEHMYCDVVYWGALQKLFSFMFMSTLEIFRYVGVFIISLISLIFFPVSLLFRANIGIKISKKWIKK